jgi:hypothetical protein
VLPELSWSQNLLSQEHLAGIAPSVSREPS